MLLFGLFLLVPTAVLAADHEVKAGSNLIFNFEQRRRDQPPLIEMRDESMSRYMHRRPTTTMSPIAVHDQHQMNELNYYHPAPLHPTQSSGPVITTPETHYAPWPSPPSPPQWTDLSQTFQKQSIPHYEKPIEHRTPIEPYFVPHQPNQHFTTPVPRPQEMPSTPQYIQPQPTTPVQMIDHHKNDFRRNPALPTRAPVSRPRNQFGQPSRQTVRGNHKFSWDDLVTEPSWKTQETTTTTTLRTPAANPPSPHPIPTLTPWTDGF